jgi:hypothetical protein
MKPLLLLALCYVPALWAQDDGRQPLTGIVIGAKPGDVSVVNRATEKTAASAADGHFTLPSKPGDTLVFASSANQLKEIVVMEKDFDGGLAVTLQPAIALDEVVVEKSRITAASVGIPGASVLYTPAERRLASGSGQLNHYGLNNEISLDGIINGISGKTAELRKNVEAERKEDLIAKLENWYEESFFTRDLNIPADYVRGFLFYVVENSRMTRVLSQHNKTTIAFLMTQLALDYKDRIACEQE